MTAGTWPHGGAVALPEPKPPLVELRPPFLRRHGDTVVIGFDDAMRLAAERAAERGHRQVVTRCYSDETRIATPLLARFWCIQDWR